MTRGHGQQRGDGPWARGEHWVEGGKRERRNWDNCNKINSKK